MLFVFFIPISYVPTRLFIDLIYKIITENQILYFASLSIIWLLCTCLLSFFYYQARKRRNMSLYILDALFAITILIDILVLFSFIFDNPFVYDSCGGVFNRQFLQAKETNNLDFCNTVDQDKIEFNLDNGFFKHNYYCFSPEKDIIEKDNFTETCMSSIMK